ncbi:MAG TPA: hypothetical protein VL326_10330 [Kofleriaceae bacterium]|nr:hypothetical protein [Kofleriaceae bacterium]
MRRVVCLVLFAGCSGDHDPRLFAVPALMVGSSSTASVSFERCMPSPDDGDSCRTIQVPVDSATIDDPAVFALEDMGDFYRYTALAVGTAKLTVTADGDTFTRELRAAVPDMVDADLTCWVASVPLFGDPAWTAKAFGTNSEVEVKYKLFVSDGTPFGTELSHDANVVPLESPLLTLDTSKVVDHDHAVLMTGDAPGASAITSPFDPAVQIPLEVFTAADATGFRLDETRDAIILSSNYHLSFESYLTVRNGEPTCMDHFPRTVRTLTPDTCMPWDWTQRLPTLAVNGRDQIIIEGIAPGTCTIELALDGTSLTLQKSYPVTAN